MSEDNEPIIDALLEELLGGEQPPDLTQRILGAYDASTDSSIDVQIGKATTTQGPSSDSANGHSPTVNPVRHKSSTKRPVREKKSFWQPLVSAAIILMAAGGFWYWSNVMLPAEIAENAPPEIPRNDTDPKLAETPQVLPKEFNQEDYFPPESNNDRLLNGEGIADGSQQELLPPDPAEIEEGMFESPRFKRTIEFLKPKSDQKVLAFVNRQLETTWDRSSSPLPGVRDSVWFYRATLFLTGSPPTENQRKWFAQRLDREAATEALVQSKAFATRWSNFMSTVLVGEKDNNNVAIEELQKYLSESIRADKPYDQLAFELITAAGANKPSESDFNPATNFLLAHQLTEWVNDKNRESHRVGATEKVGQVFLGKQLQCARCHDHEDVSQEQYYQMLSFFTQMRPINAQQKGGVSRLANTDYLGTDGNVDEADVYFSRYTMDPEDTTNGTVVSVYPQFLNGEAPATKSGRVKDINRRAVLAELIVASDDFPKAFVNRIWDEAFGVGFTRPIDAMGKHNKPSHPALLDGLAADFRNSKFDIKALMKWVVMSQAFDRQSRSLTDPYVGRPDAFSSFARRFDSLHYRSLDSTLGQLAKAKKAGGQLDPYVVLAQQADVGDGKKKQSKPDRIARERAHFNATTFFVKNAYGGLINDLAENEKLTDRLRVVHLFLATVGRLPTKGERNRGIQILEGDRNLKASLQDVCKILLNSAEFASQH